MKSFQHPFIIAYFGEYVVRCHLPYIACGVDIGVLSDLQTPACICMVFQYAPGGELFTRMKKQITMPESHAMFYAGEIALTLNYLHGLHIVYRFQQFVWTTMRMINYFDIYACVPI